MLLTNELNGGLKMKKSIMALSLGFALITSTTLSARAEPITLAVVAISGITAVALSAAADKVVHSGDVGLAAQKTDERRATLPQAAEVETIHQAEKANPSVTAVK
jgi:hypothetical protein